MYHALRMPLNITRSCSRPLSYEKHAGCSLTDVRRLPQSRSQASEASHGRHAPLFRCDAGLLGSLASDTGKLMHRARDAAACAALTGALAVTVALTAAPTAWAVALSGAAREDAASMESPARQQDSSGSRGNGGIFQGSLASCRPDASCVSTSALSAPRSYMPPWLFAPILQSQAYRWGQG